MQPFRCSVCRQLVFFDNFRCLSCDSPLGFAPELGELLTLSVDFDRISAVGRESASFRRCANHELAKCNWLVDSDDPEALCRSCRLTSVRPNDADHDAAEPFAEAEAAKRRLLAQLNRLGLPVIDRLADRERGLTFELLSSWAEPVTTGHASGVITLDLSESDDAHREFVRQQLGEPYRTVLGHLRHEIGHYYWPLLVEAEGRIDDFRDLFGDERESYEQAKDNHYADGENGDWQETHVSRYATMHPWEDWAETFAHYLHIDAGLMTADEFGLSVDEPSAPAGRAAWAGGPDVAVGPMVRRWLSLTIALNGMSRAIGQQNHYPFVLSPTVVTKLDFVHRAIQTDRTRLSTAPEPGRSAT